MKTFHHGGRIGDLVFALWTMKALGGGRLIVSDFHQGNWSLEVARSMESFLRYQCYIEDVVFEPYLADMSVDYDLHEAENDFNPHMFPGVHFNGTWPGGANIAKRYALHFGLEFDGQPWLTAPSSMDVDIAFHCPMRRSVRSLADWQEILDRLRRHCPVIAILGSGELISGYLVRNNLLASADYINCAQVFLGTVSSCNAIAEGLGRTTLVEQASDCFNVRPTVSLNGISNQQVVDEVMKRCSR